MPDQVHAKPSDALLEELDQAINKLDENKLRTQHHFIFAGAGGFGFFVLVLVSVVIYKGLRRLFAREHTHTYVLNLNE